MAVSARVVRQRPTSVPSTAKYVRPKPTPRQRELRTERGNIRVKAAHAVYVKREAGRITRENQASGTIEQNKRESYRTGEAQKRIHQREEAILHRYREGIGIRRSERLQRQLIEEPTVGAIKPAANSAILVVVVGFGLIILYAIVTHAEGLSGALSGISNIMATFTQTGPLFSKTST